MLSGIFRRISIRFLQMNSLRELKDYGRIYMYRFLPDYEIKARNIDDFPYRSRKAAAIMLMISNNLDLAVAQHPHELITYGGNGAVFQNWAQYLVAMKYLSEMTDDQTLVMYSGHPLGLFPSHRDAPRVVVTNGMMIPNYSSQDDWERFNAMGVTQYGQMTAGSYMYIGPQGIVHGTTITLLNAGRLTGGKDGSLSGKLFVSSGLGGMSGAQPKAAKIAGIISVIAEVNPKAIHTRHKQGWVDEVIGDMDLLVRRVKAAQEKKEIVSLAYQGNIVEVWEKFADEGIKIDLGSDQTSLHNPWAGGYYPAGLGFEESNRMISDDPERFRDYVRKSLVRQVDAINRHTQGEPISLITGMHFFWKHPGRERIYLNPTENSDIRLMYRILWVLFASITDSAPSGGFAVRTILPISKPPIKLLARTLGRLMKSAPDQIRQQMADNIHWIKEAGRTGLLLGRRQGYFMPMLRAGSLWLMLSTELSLRVRSRLRLL